MRVRSFTQAHPRSRGENTVKGEFKFRDEGSSPLTRGKHIQESRCLAQARLIPAHAGKTGWAISTRSPGSAHPRSRGENTEVVALLMPIAGSSPLTRGKQRRAPYKVKGGRLIPAHAGKTWSLRDAWSLGAAHPRSRGENCPFLWRVVGGDGSSPLTRGKRHSCRPLGSLVRLIPAHAGKTARGSQAHRPCWAHPRSRGENLVGLNSGPELGGSSPLTRGKQGGQVMDTTALRLIPAHAGKT